MSCLGQDVSNRRTKSEGLLTSDRRGPSIQLCELLCTLLAEHREQSRLLVALLLAVAEISFCRLGQRGERCFGSRKGWEELD